MSGKLHKVIPSSLIIANSVFVFASTEKDRLPNIVFILADDLGYGDLGCYGQKLLATPNIDKIARDGMLFRNHYTGCTVSAPSRSSLMTGLHTGHTPIRGNKGWKPEGNWPLPDQSVTVAEVLKEKGYRTGAFGKWGLGYIDTPGSPNNQGFDEFYGYNCQSLAHNYYPDHLWNNGNRIELPENENGKYGAYSGDLIQKAALNFIISHRNEPFFLFYPTTIPHAELIAKEEYMSQFEGKFLPEKEYLGVDDGPSFRKGPYASQKNSHAAFAAMIKQLDDYVGELMLKLDELGIADNTIILFASDNGPHLEGGADPDYFDSNGLLKGYKRDLFEGGIRTPLLVKWPGVIKPGSVSDHVSAFWDILPTFADITGAKTPEKLDGISFLNELKGKRQKVHPYLYWEFHELGGRQAVRMGEWKGIRLNINSDPDGQILLFNLISDQGETTDLAEKYPSIVTKLTKAMDEAHVTSNDFKFEFEKESVASKK